MYRLTAHLLIFFVLFTHSAIAMDVHVPHTDAPQLAVSAETAHSHNDGTTSSQKADSPLQDCGDLGGHCSHSTTHVSGLASHFVVPLFNTRTILNGWVDLTSYLHNEAPLFKPPRV